MARANDQCVIGSNFKIWDHYVIIYVFLAVNCMYWEERFPRLLSTQQLQDLMKKRCPLVGIADITCDIGGSIEFVNQTTSIDSPIFRYSWILSNSNCSYCFLFSVIFIDMLLVTCHLFVCFTIHGDFS